jgi:hypothetical protein
VNAPGLSYNFTSVDSLQKYMQAQTPNDLTTFFQNWVFKKGKATYAVKYQYVTNGVYIQLTQSPTFAGAGYFDMPVPLQIKNATGLDTTVVLIDRAAKLYNSVTGTTFNSNTYFFRLSATPTIAPVFDPNNNVLATASSIAPSVILSTTITLPIQDIHLSVSNNAPNATINWKVIADEQLESVEIEKSRYGRNFATIAKSPAAMSLPDQYTGRFVDTLAGDGLLFYRLKVNKMDGSYAYSAVKAVNLTSGVQLSITPNPVQNSCTISIPSSYKQNKPMNLLIYNAAGLLLHEEKVAVNTSAVTVSCNSLIPGVYKVVLVNEKQILQSQFLKQ